MISTVRALVVILVASLVASSALGDDARDRARELATSGIELYHQERPDLAYERLTEAETLFPAVTHRVYLARCLVAMGRLVEAKASYEAIAAEPRPSDLSGPASEAYATAASELSALEPRIPRVRVIVSGEGTVRIDGRPLDRAALAAPIPVDPGAHRVAAGDPPVERVFTIAEGELREIALSLPAITPDREPTPSREGSLVPAAIAFGVGGAALVLGAVTGGISLAKVADIETRCVDRRCPPEDEEEAMLARRLGTTSTVAFAVGGAAVATGVVLAILKPGGDRSALTPIVGPGFAGLRGRF